MAEVRIIVSGPCGSGKSALLGEIEIMLKALGVPVRYEDAKGAQAEKNGNHADWTAELEMYDPSVVLVEDMPWLRKDGASLLAQQGEALDAARWRALLGSQRIRMLGSAGLNKPEANNYAHFGMEIWTIYGSRLTDEQRETMKRGNEQGRDWLTKYADIAIDAAMLAARREG